MNRSTYKLSDIGEVKMCKRVLKSQTTKSGDVPFFKISTFGGKPDAFISQLLYSEYRKKFSFPKKGEVLISAAGTLGRTVIYDGQPSYFQDSNIVWINNDESKVLNKYLYYFYQTQPWRTTKGSTINRIYNDNLSNLNIACPSLKEQRYIASILEKFDNKIDLNRKINFELEQLAKLIYGYWFVQFDFSDENGKPYKSCGGKMVWNEELKREIPKFWQVGNLSDIAHITMGHSPPGESYNKNGAGIVFYQGCTDFGNRFPKPRLYTTSPSRFADLGDILLSIRAPVGDLNIAKEKCCIGRGLAALRSKENSVSYLLGILMNLKQIFDRRNTNGTTFGAITKDDLFSLKVIKPAKDVLDRYQALASPIFEMQNTLEKENNTLIELRDWLLPMLMNGQITIK